MGKYISTKTDTTKLALTIYNYNFGMVKEQRKLALPADADRLDFLDVAEQLEVDSILVSGLEVLESNFDYDLISKTKLLEKYLGKLVFLVDEKTRTKLEYRLLSVANGLVLEDVETGEIVLNPKAELILPKLPQELIIKPALIWKLKREQTAQQLEVSYLTKGISWTGNYVVNLRNNKLDLAGWVNIQNNSGMTYENAQLKLIAGDVNRVREAIPRFLQRRSYDSYFESDSPRAFEEKAFADYHLYTLNGTTTLKNNQSKQINFLNAREIPCRKYYELSEYDQNPRIVIEVANKVANKIGLPLPKGNVKVYQEDEADQSLEFIGEDVIHHTPKDETVRLKVGKAFDIKCEGPFIHTWSAENYKHLKYKYKIKNHKDEAAVINFKQYIPNLDWKMVRHSEPDYFDDDERLIEFWFEVESDDEHILWFEYKTEQEKKKCEDEDFDEEDVDFDEE